MQKLLFKGLSVETKDKYANIQQAFVDFCGTLGAQAVPCSSNTLSLYLTSLKGHGFKPPTIRVHLAAIKNLHIVNDRSLTVVESPKWNF